MRDVLASPISYAVCGNSENWKNLFEPAIQQVLLSCSALLCCLTGVLFPLCVYVRVHMCMSLPLLATMGFRDWGKECSAER